MSKKPPILFQPGFTLIELMIAVVVIGILASISLPRYFQTVERGRTAEARNALGLIRSAQSSYFFENGFYTTSVGSLYVNVPSVACDPSYYFRYVITGGGASYTAWAYRCTAGGKNPPSTVAYNLNITQAGILGGTPGYI